MDGDLIKFGWRLTNVAVRERMSGTPHLVRQQGKDHAGGMSASQLQPRVEEGGDQAAAGISYRVQNAGQTIPLVELTC